MRSSSEKVAENQLSDSFEVNRKFAVFDVQYRVTAIVAIADGARIKKRNAIIFGKILIMCVPEKRDVRSRLLCLISNGPEILLIFYVVQVTVRGEYKNAFDIKDEQLFQI